MLADATGADRAGFARAFDVCVVGSGPAGITIARRLAAQGLDVALMEAGGFEITAEAQDPYVGENVGLDYLDLDALRLRVFGGSSGHWSGRCRTLDALDFTALPHRQHAWPIGKTELDPYRAEADAILDLTEPEGPDIAIRQAVPRFREAPWRHSPPTRFGEKYRDPVVADPRITLVLNANLVDLRLAPDLATVEEAVFRCYTPGDPGFAVRARAFALCTGGIENPRLLLNFTSQKPAGIGNDHDLVGRYFCEHPSFTIADVIYRERLGVEQYDVAPTLGFMLREQTLGYALWLESRDNPAQPLGDALSATAQCLTPTTRHLARALLGRRPRCHWGGIEEFLTRRYPDSYSWGWAYITLEQSLQPDSRVGLGPVRDAFGLRRVQLDWRLAEIDYRTLKVAILALGEHMIEQNIGRMRVRDGLLDDPVVLPETAGRNFTGGWHQMCTTRMDDDPRQGVIDRNCRVHGTANLYIGGSSVFASPGFTAPTYTIVQLALRLGDHLGFTLQA
jgi:choline dehydrogenase-like flavoprotein